MASSSTRKRGSKAYWPRKRAQKSVAVVNSWDSKILPKEASFLGFPAYKVGMTHVGVIDNFSHTLTKGTQVNLGATVLECPAIKVLSVRLYAKDDWGHIQVVKEVLASTLDKELSRKLDLPKKAGKLPTAKELLEAAKELAVEDVKVKVYTMPGETGIGKKKPDVLELGVSGSIEDKITFALSKLGKDVRINDVFNSGDLVDSHGITVGKGHQGAVKRFGVKFTSHKSEKKRRHAGNVGAWTPSRVTTTIPLPGQMGYHERTEWNKWILKVSDKPEEVNPSAGFKHYGVVKNDYLIIKGSVQGPKKRLVTLVRSIRPNARYPKIAPEITYINK